MRAPGNPCMRPHPFSPRSGSSAPMASLARQPDRCRLRRAQVRQTKPYAIAQPQAAATKIRAGTASPHNRMPDPPWIRPCLHSEIAAHPHICRHLGKGRNCTASPCSQPDRCPRTCANRQRPRIPARPCDRDRPHTNPGPHAGWLLPQKGAESVELALHRVREVIERERLWQENRVRNVGLDIGKAVFGIA